jgi:hypothetical protein
MQRVWKEISRDGQRAQWAGIYVTMNPKGMIVLSSSAYHKTGAPNAYLLLWDAANYTIGLKPTVSSTKNAYPATKSGKHGGRKISAYRLIAECALHIEHTLEFVDAEIDREGVLLLNLRTAKVSNRALNHPRRRKVEFS